MDSTVSTVSVTPVVVALVFIGAILSAGVAAFIVWTKGRKVSMYALGGLLLGPIGIVAAMFALDAKDVASDKLARNW